MLSAEEKIKISLDNIATMVEQGKTDKEIAENIGIGYSTYRRYKSTDSDLKAVISEGKDKKNQSVEQALYNNAIGYYYDKEVVTKVKLGEHEEGVKISKIKEYVKPDLAAQKYWLENKEKMKWQGDPSKAANDKKLTKLKEKEVNNKVIDM